VNDDIAAFPKTPIVTVKASGLDRECVWVSILKSASWEREALVEQKIIGNSVIEL
jgi:hypothetical protein